MKKAISVFTALTTILWLSGALAVFPVYGATLVDGDVARETGDVDVYIIKLVGTAKFKRLILNPDVFTMYGHLKWGNVKVVAAGELAAYTTSELVRAQGDEKVYKLYPDGDVGTKKWVESLDCFTSSGFDWNSVYVINSFDRDSYTTSSVTLCEGAEAEEEATGEEGYFEIKLYPTPAAVDIMPDESNVAVVGYELKAKDSAIRLQRVDFTFEQTEAGGDLQPWKYFDKIALEIGGSIVASKTISSKSDFYKVDSPVYTLRFSNFSETISKDAKKIMNVLVTTKSVIGETNLANNAWEVLFDELRAVDGAGLQYTSGTMTSGDSGRIFYVVDEEAGDVEVTENESNLDERVVFVSETSTTSDVELLAFDIKAKETAIMVTDVEILLASVGADIDDMAITAKLYRGTTLLDNVTVDSSGEVTFTDLEISIAKDATVTMYVKVDLNKIGTLYEAGDAIQADLVGFLYDDAIGNEGETGPALTAGNFAYLYEIAPVVSKVSTSLTVRTGDHGYLADGEIKFTVKAKGGSIWVSALDSEPTEASTSFSITHASVSIELLDWEATNATEVDIENGVWKINSGATATFTAEFTAENTLPASTASARVLIDKFGWSAEGPDDDDLWEEWGDSFKFIEELKTPVRLFLAPLL